MLTKCSSLNEIINEAEGLKINDVRVINHDLKEVALREIVKNGPKLVFRFPRVIADHV